MGLYDRLKTSPKLEKEGVWLDIDTARIRIARSGGSNLKFQVAAEKMARENKRAFDLGLMTSEKGKELLCDLYANTIISDWLTQVEGGELDGEGDPYSGEGLEYKRGLESPTGDIIEFSTANVIATLKSLSDLLGIVKETSESVTYYRAALIEHIAKN